jgi:hypothetical protein
MLLPTSSPSPASPETGSFSLQAYIWCYPAGFVPSRLLGLPLAAIHAPVPGYASKLEKSMDRYFSRLKVGRVVTRTNVSLFLIPLSRVSCQPVQTDSPSTTYSGVSPRLPPSGRTASMARITSTRTGIRLPRIGRLTSRNAICDVSCKRSLPCRSQGEGYWDCICTRTHSLKLRTRTEGTLVETCVRLLRAWQGGMCRRWQDIRGLWCGVTR